MTTTNLLGGISFESSFGNPSRVSVKLEWKDYIVDTAEKGEEIVKMINQFFSELNEEFRVEYTVFPNSIVHKRNITANPSPSVLGLTLKHLSHEILEISIDSQWLDAIVVTIESVLFKRTISDVENCVQASFVINCPPEEMIRRTQTISASEGIRRVYRLQSKNFPYNTDHLRLFLQNSIEHLEIQIGFKSFLFGSDIELWFSRYPSKRTFSVFAKILASVQELEAVPKLKTISGMDFHKD